MNDAYLILGSNIGNKLVNINFAFNAIANNIGAIVKSSSIYVTKAWGNGNQPDYYNQVLLISTLYSPSQLLEQVLLIEKKLGRTRGEIKWQERIIDIDILFYNEMKVNLPQLKIPHPLIKERMFVLVPLEEIANSFIHPTYNKSICELRNECNDDLEVFKL